MLATLRHGEIATVTTSSLLGIGVLHQLVALPNVGLNDTVSNTVLSVNELEAHKTPTKGLRRTALRPLITALSRHTEWFVGRVREQAKNVICNALRTKQKNSNCSPGWHFWVARGGLDVSQGMDDSAVSIPPEQP
jgi:hypothetical protein